MSESKQKRRITIGIPCFDKVYPEVLDDYMRLSYYFGRRYPEYDFFLAIKTKSEQFRARNNIIQAALQMDCDFLLFLDDDHIFDWRGSNYASDCYDFLHRLINHMDMDPRLGAVGALYFHRGGQCLPVSLIWDEANKSYRYLTDNEISGGLQKVDVTGGGVMLLRMEALKLIPEGWCEPELEWGTDFQLCRKLAGLGFTIATDTGIEVGHLSSSVTTITPLNRHMVQAETGQLVKDLAQAGRLGRIYADFQDEVVGYLGLPEKAAMSALANVYSEHRLKIEEYRDMGELEQYYRDTGPGYLARAALLARLGTAWPSSWDDYLLNIIRKGQPAVAVEFGAGSGRLSFELAKMGHKVYFLDLDGVPTYEFLKWRCDKHGLTGSTAIFGEWPPPNSCDYAIFSDVIEHLEDWKTPVIQAVKCLKPGGAFLTNFLLLIDDGNSEHIFMDRPQFSQFMRSINMASVNPAMWTKPMIKQAVKEEMAA